MSGDSKDKKDDTTVEAGGTSTGAEQAAARTAWIAARVPYQQTEVFRFGNAIVDDWEGKVNAWPLDEGLIDYVDTTYGGPTDENQFAALNVVANPTFTLSGEEIDATAITPELLADTLHEADEVEANVATGYHAIEFLLWGQDLNGTDHGAGGVAFVIGERVNGGMYGQYPSLREEDQLDGDLRFQVDFRSVYSTIVEKWLGLDAKSVTGGSYEHLDFV